MVIEGFLIIFFTNSLAWLTCCIRLLFLNFTVIINWCGIILSLVNFLGFMDDKFLGLNVFGMSEFFFYAFLWFPVYNTQKNVCMFFDVFLSWFLVALNTNLCANVILYPDFHQTLFYKRNTKHALSYLLLEHSFY